MKAAFLQRGLSEFYQKMGEIFRAGFGTESENEKGFASGITSLLFGKSEKEKK